MQRLRQPLSPGDEYPAGVTAIVAKHNDIIC